MPPRNVHLSFLPVSVRPRAGRTVIQLGSSFLESFSCAGGQKGFEAGNQLWHWPLQKLNTCAETMSMPTLLPTQCCVTQQRQLVLQVSPTLAHHSDIPSGSAYWIITIFFPFGILSDIFSGIYFDILSDTLCGIYADILSGVYSDILSDIKHLFRILSGILYHILSGMNLRISSDILSGTMSGTYLASILTFSVTWALPDLNRERQMLVGTAGPRLQDLSEPRAPQLSGHFWTPTASSRSQ